MDTTLMIIVFILLFIFIAVVSVASVILSRRTFFCAFPRTSAYGDPNKLMFIHLKGFFFIISNDLAGNDIVYSTEASNLVFQYNLKPTMDINEILNNKQYLNIEILDTRTNQTMSYRVQHSNKPAAIRFFTKYRELMNRINQHKLNSKNEKK